MPRWAPAWASLRELGSEIENNLALLVTWVYHNQTVPALALSQHMALVLGWDWSGGAATHLTAVGGGFAPCWDEVALLATMLDPAAPNPGGPIASEQRIDPFFHWGGSLGLKPCCRCLSVPLPLPAIQLILAPLKGVLANPPLPTTCRHVCRHNTGAPADARGHARVVVSSAERVFPRLDRAHHALARPCERKGA